MDLTESCTFTVYGSHTANQITTHFTQFLSENDQNSTSKSLHVSHNTIYSQICHKYIHINGWKGQTSKEIAGMLRAFPVHFVPLQSKFTQCNVYGSRAATENWMKCNISLKHSFGQIIVNFKQINLKSVYCVHRYTKMLHVNRVREPHVTQIWHSFLQKMIKIPLGNPCMWVTTLSTLNLVINTFISWGKIFKQINMKSV